MTIVGLVDRGGMPHPPPGATVNPLLPRELPDAHLGRLAEDRQRVAGADEDPPGGDGGYGEVGMCLACRVSRFCRLL